MLAANDETDDKAEAECAEDAFGWVLTDIVFCGDVKFFSDFARFVPLFGGDFFEVSCFLGSDDLESFGFLFCGFFEVMSAFDCLFFKDGRFLFGGVCEFFGFFGSGVSERRDGFFNRFRVLWERKWIRHKCRLIGC